MEKIGTGSTKVLLIPPLIERHAKAVVNQLHVGQQSFFTFYSVTPVPRYNSGQMNYEALLDKCREVINTQGIRVLYANKPLGVTVMSVLVQEYPHLRGPSFESVFLCNHKLYTTTCVDSRKQCLPFIAKNIDGDNFDIAYELIEHFIRPAIVRFALGSGHTVYKYCNRDQLVKVLAQCQRNVDHVLDLHRWLIKNFGDKEKYPLALEPLVLIQPYLDRCLAPRGFTWRNVSIEAAVFGKDIIPWAVCDGVTLPYNDPNPTRYFCGSEMPTQLTGPQETILLSAFKDDIRKLMDKGFTNSFVHAEYMVFETGTVHLITMNSRVHAKCVHMYKHALVRGNNVKAALEMGQGLRPRTPKLSGKYVLNYSLVTFKSFKVDDLIEYPSAKFNPNVHLNYSSGEEITIGPAKDFTVFGYITVTGENFADCILQIKKIRNQIFVHPEKIPFTE